MIYSADEIIKNFKMQKHYEGGYYKFIWASDKNINKKALSSNYNGDRKMVSLIYYLLKAGDESAWHKLLSDEIWLWHCGGTLEMTLGGKKELPEKTNSLFIGQNFNYGESFQAIVPAETWQTTKVLNGDFVLASCVVSPGFATDDFYSHMEIETWED